MARVRVLEVVVLESLDDVIVVAEVHTIPFGATKANLGAVADRAIRRELDLRRIGDQARRAIGRGRSLAEQRPRVWDRWRRWC